MLKSIYLLLGLAVANASPTKPQPSSSFSHVPSGKCTSYTITVPITTDNYIWALPPFKDNFDVAAFLFNSSRKDSREVFAPFAGTEKVTKKYTISASFCAPKATRKGKENTVLLATHGGAYDSRYWAPTHKLKEYSFVEHAVSAGYSVFFYDRIGTGNSQKESGYVAQGSQAIAVIRQLASYIKAGKYTGSIRASKLVLVGHSFGSFTSNAALAQEPDLADGVVLTGFSYPNATLDLAATYTSWGATVFGSRIASTVDRKNFPPSRFDTGYCSFVDKYSHVDAFLHDYERDVAEYAQTIVQPVAVAEITSLGLLELAAPTYKGKVFVTAGERDLLLCGGDCTSTFKTGSQSLVWSHASVLKTYIHPGSGHGLNFNKNATGFYGEIVRFLDENF